MIFPPNNLPTASKNWAREVEKKVTNLESSFRSAEVNNTTRDSQLSVTANSALAAATQASAAAAAAAQAAAEAQAAATTANTAATTANNAINGLGSLDEPTSSYKINAANVTVGSLSGDRISGGEIVGTLLRTASSGARVQLNLNDIAFYDDTGDYSGKIDAQGDGRSSTLNIDSQGLSGMYLYNGGLELYANGPVGVNAQQLISYGAFSATGNATVSQTLTVNGATNANGGVSTTSVTASGDLNLTGRILGSTGTYNATTTSTANVFVASNGNFARSTSSRRYKSDIQDIDYGLTALQLQPRTWVDKSEYEANGNSTDGLERIPGFIAEELHELGLTELVQYNEDGQPDAVYYDRMLVAVIPVLKSQQQTIEQLTARIEALESR